jgi:signal transduction histidine kinase
VTVATVCESGVHRVTVQDNGAGFDPKKRDSDVEAHIGLRSVRDRVEQMCGGTMVLRSEIGKGTSITLRIPDSNVRDKRERKNEGNLRG